MSPKPSGLLFPRGNGVLLQYNALTFHKKTDVGRAEIDTDVDSGQLADPPFIVIST